MKIFIRIFAKKNQKRINLETLNKQFLKYEKDLFINCEPCFNLSKCL